MKRRMVSIFLCVVMVATVFAVAVPMNVCPSGSETGLVAYWNFDEGEGTTAHDFSSNNNHGTIYGDPEWVKGIRGNALEFDGVGDYIEVYDDPSLDITDGATIECWVILIDFPGIYVYNIIGKGTSPIDRWRLDITSFGQSLRFKTGGDILIEYEVSFMLNTWYYFAVTWDGQIAIMYMNGINIGSDSIGSFSNPPANIFISSEAGLKDYVNGIIDEVRIWNRALSLDEIRSHYYEMIEVTIDIDPDTIQLAGGGQFVTCYIELSESYDVRNIDATTLLLEDTLSPELDPKYGFVNDEDSYIVDEDEDGILERMVKFNRDDVEDMLSPGIYNLKVTGELIDGTIIEGYSDEIKVIDPP